MHTHIGLGTRFTITFPLVAEQPQPGRRAPGTKRSSGVYYAETLSGRILVVDDDTSLREMIAAALAMRGAEVVAVGSPEAALAERGPFALAIVDLRLPEASGDVLAARLVPQAPRTGTAHHRHGPPSLRARRRAQRGAAQAVRARRLFEQLSQLLSSAVAIGR